MKAKARGAMERRAWQEYSGILKEVLQLDHSPVAVNCLQNPPSSESAKKVRTCRAILDAGKGQTLYVNKANNACFGASWHLGFHKIKDNKVRDMVNKFVVEGEKLFSSYAALDNLMRECVEPPDNSDSYFLFAPMERAEQEPQIVIFVVNAEAACRLLTFLTFFEGRMPKFEFGGPTCRMSIIYPMISGEANISFYDYTARKMCNVEKDKLIVTLPYATVVKIIQNLDNCSGGRAKVEFPPEFRAFLQKRLTGSGPA